MEVQELAKTSQRREGKVGQRGSRAAHQCWLSQKTIAERVEYSVPSVQRALRTLNVKGLALTSIQLVASCIGRPRRGKVLLIETGE